MCTHRRSCAVASQVLDMWHALAFPQSTLCRNTCICASFVCCLRGRIALTIPRALALDRALRHRAERDAAV